MTALSDTVGVPAGTLSNRKIQGRDALSNDQRRELPRDKHKEKKKSKREGQVTTDAIPGLSTPSNLQAKASGKKAKATVSFYIIKLLSFR
jgi:hypothetical protein